MYRQRCGRAIVLLVGIFTLWAMLDPGAASAQTAPDSAGLSVSNPTNELSGNPGDNLTVDLTVTDLNETRALEAHAENFTAPGQNGQADPTPDATDYPLAPWVHINPSSVTVAPSQRQTFHVSVNIPRNASPGTHYGVIIISPKQSATGGGNVRVLGEVSALIFVDVSGKTTQKATLTNFSTFLVTSKTDPTKPVSPDSPAKEKNTGFFQQGPVHFAATFQNQGNITVRPQGTITVTNMFGQKVGSLKLDVQRVLPGSSRKLEMSWGHTALLGRYKAKLDWNLADGDKTQPASVEFWGAPLKKVFAGLGIVVVIFCLVWVPRKRYKKALRALLAD